MRLTVVDAVGRAGIAGGGADRDAELRSRPERLIHGIEGLSRPLALGRAPADLDHGRRPHVVVHRCEHCVQEAARRVRREVDGDPRARGDRPHDLDVQHHFAVAAGSPVGMLRPPSTPTATTVGAATPISAKYLTRSMLR